MRKKQLYTILTLVLMIFIFSRSALPANLSDKESGIVVSMLMKVIKVNEDTLTFLIRKSAHFMEYMILGCSLFLTVRAWLEESTDGDRRIMWSSQKMNMVAYGIGTLYAISDELHQSLVSGRSCELRDVLIDSAGVACGILVCSGLLCMFGKRKI